MQVILLENIKTLGNLGDLIKVKPGYGRNYLIPTGKALMANAANKAYFDAKRAELEQEMHHRLSDAEARLEAVNQLSIRLTARAGDEGRLFGSVTAHDIAEAIKQQGVTVSKHEIRLEQGPIRQLGEHPVGIHLHSEVTTEIMVTVVAE
ncbi:MAG: ribosomal protein [Pseudomonadota bacterium]|jgi:large subunit ribosomal protein L9